MCVRAHHISSDFLQSYAALPLPSGQAAIRQVGFEMKPRLSYAGMTKDREAVLSSFTFSFCLSEGGGGKHIYTETGTCRDERSVFYQM